MLRVGRRLPRLIEQQINLGEREAGDLHTEFEIDKGQFDREHLTVPAGVRGELVVDDDIGPTLSCIEVAQAKRRNALYPEKLGSFDAAMPGDDLVIITDQDRVGEAEFLDAVGVTGNTVSPALDVTHRPLYRAGRPRWRVFGRGLGRFGSEHHASRRSLVVE